ncbi:MAG: flagellar protein FlaG [bacterium]
MDNVTNLDAAMLAKANVEALSLPVRSSSPTMDAQVLGTSGSQSSDKGADRSAAIELDNELLRELVDRVTQAYQSRSISLSFAVDEAAARTVITVMDTNTDKAIRQIPPDEILALIRNLKKMQGMLFDTEA